jgi:hypothetical protein
VAGLGEAEPDSFFAGAEEPESLPAEPGDESFDDDDDESLDSFDDGDEAPALSPDRLSVR